MVKLLIAFILCTMNYQVNSFTEPTLTKQLLVDMRQGNDVYPAACQVIFTEKVSYLKTDLLEATNIYIYGNGSTYIDYLHYNAGGEYSQLECWSGNSIVPINEVLDKLVEKGVFEYSSDANILNTARGDKCTEIFLSIRVGEYYKSFMWDGIDIGDPDWVGLINYIKDNAVDFEIEQNETEQEVYLNQLYEEFDLYGISDWVGWRLVKLFVEDGFIY